ALTFQGNVDTDSYDSTSMSGATSPTFSGSGGDVATNGNLSLGGSSDINGNLYTPRAGVGDCTEGTVTALDENGGADVNGSIVQLPAAVTYPTPPLPTAWQDSTSAQFMTLTSTTVAIDSSTVNTTACAS